MSSVPDWDSDVNLTLPYLTYESESDLGGPVLIYPFKFPVLLSQQSQLECPLYLGKTRRASVGIRSLGIRVIHITLKISLWRVAITILVRLSFPLVVLLSPLSI